MDRTIYETSPGVTPDQRSGLRFTITQMLLLVGVVVIALWLCAKPYYEIIVQWRLPKDDPSSQVQYYLSVVEDGLDLGSIIPSRNYSIFIGRGSSIHYGHFVNFPYDPSTYASGSVPDHIRRCKIQTTTAGLTFKTPPGHTLFIPASEYLGGR